MNEYFQTITEIVFRHDGTAASIVGDAMLAVFGIPVTAINHADQAIAAAIEIQMASKQLREKWKAGDALPLESGIGINTGEVIVGEVGGQHLRNFTVYGLHVNIASRVEALNRDFKTEILLTRSTYEALEKPVSVGPALSVQVKGLVEPIDVFELCGY
jgi:adenylate cyclase